MAAVHRMKKVKREKKSPIELEEEARSFIAKMDAAAVADEAAVAERRPALQKLSLLNEVCDTLKNKDMQRLLLDLNVLSVVRRWMAPLPNGTLGNVTVRQRLLDAIRNMTGEKGITANDLKESELGKTVMILYKHRSETPNMKRQWKALVEQWSRPIFQKSGNMRDLERVHGARGADGLAALARQQQLATRQQEQRSQQRQAAASEQDLDSLIASGKKGGTESGGNRVRVPFSKGFAFSVRPDSKAVGAGSPEKRSSGGGAKEDGTRSKLAKRMVEKNRLAGKNQRSANVSVEGRVSKG
jgi:transcription factor SPN1